MKIAISGKGGVGKTTLAAGLAHYFADRGETVFAVDADPDLNLGTVLGIPDEMIRNLKPIADMKEVIAERTGGEGPYFSLNPEVDDLLMKYSIKLNGIHFLKMGSIKAGGTSCYCRENVVLHAMVGSLLLKHHEVVILDMGAGIEHLTRGTARGVDIMMVVSEPSKVSIQSADVISQLARDIGIEEVRFVGNKVRNEKEENLLTRTWGDRLIGIIHHSEEVIDGAREGSFKSDPRFREEVKRIGDFISSHCAP
ncbi:MAG: AAA family ATPase [Clostridia bacterium]|nr:AAA family ATPase [Clostridia bacterium]